MFTIGFLVGFAVAAIPGLAALLIAHKRGQLIDRWEKVHKRLQGVLDIKDETLEEQRQQIESLLESSGKLIVARMKPPSDTRH